MPFEMLSCTAAAPAPKPSLTERVWQVWGVFYPVATMALAVVALCLFGMIVLAKV